MKNPNHQLERAIDAGLFALLAFTPLAFGAVEGWAEAIAQLGVMLVATAWLLGRIWSRGPRPALRLSGLEAPALLFALAVALQLVPLPPAAIDAVSPRTARIYRASLPGYGTATPGFRDLPAWLADPERVVEVGPRGGASAGEELAPLPGGAAVDAGVLPAEALERTYPAWRPLSLDPARTARALQILLAHLALFVVVFNCVDSRVRTLRVLYLLGGLAGMLAALGILQEVTGADRIYWLRPVSPEASPFATFVSRNNFAGWMEMALPVCLGLLATVWRLRAKNPQRDSGPAILLAFAALLGLAAFLLAGSRGGFVSLLVASAVYAAVSFVREPRQRRWLAAVLPIVIGAVALSAWMGGGELWSRYETLASVDREPSFLFRFDVSARTLKMAADFPALGTGFGTFGQAYALYAPGTSYKALQHAHNDYAQVASEVGLPGSVALVWGLVVLLARGVLPALSRRGSEFRWAVHGMGVGVLALLLHTAIDFNLQIYANSLLFTVLCALLLRDRADRVREAR
jgi:O-antigen ligase